MLISISNRDDYNHVANVLTNRNVGTFVMASDFNKIAKDNRLKTLDELGDSRTNDRDDSKKESCLVNKYTFYSTLGLNIFSVTYESTSQIGYT